MILAPLQKLSNNVGDLGKLIVAKGIKKLPKVQKIANSGHTAREPLFLKYEANFAQDMYLSSENVPTWSFQWVQWVKRRGNRHSIELYLV